MPADPSKELRKTGLGEFSDRPEQQDAEALCRRLPKYVKNPRRLQSGQWMVDFIQLARNRKMHLSAPSGRPQVYKYDLHVAQKSTNSAYMKP